MPSEHGDESSHRGDKSSNHSHHAGHKERATRSGRPRGEGSRPPRDRESRRGSGRRGEESRPPMDDVEEGQEEAAFVPVEETNDLIVPPEATKPATRAVEEADDDPDNPYRIGGPADLSGGIRQDRHMTDIPCICFLFVGFVAYLVVSLVGVADGDPQRLYLPRDFRGAYCGTSVDGPLGSEYQLDDFPNLAFMMNVSTVSDEIALSALCSSVAREALVEGSSPLLNSEASRRSYLCGCCFIACGTCTGSVEVGEDFTSPNNLASATTARIAELTVSAKSGDLFSRILANGKRFTQIFSDPVDFFNAVCTNGCPATEGLLTRTYSFEPDPDHPLSEAWRVLSESPSHRTIAATLSGGFAFKALGKDICPYDAKYCIPMNGVYMKETSTPLCTFDLSPEVSGKVGSVEADQLEGQGSAGLMLQEDFGTWMGDYVRTLDAFVLVAFLSLGVATMFLVLMRFFLRPFVYTVMVLSIVFWPVIGTIIYARHSQCADASLYTSTSHAAAAVVTTGSQAVSEEDLVGDGASYRGSQRYSRSGKKCQRWDAVAPHAHEYAPSSYPSSDLRENFCRNPYKPGDQDKVATIWCFTSDTEKRWEICAPIGIISGNCPYGYAVPDPDQRYALKITAYVVWVFSIVWVILIIFLFHRISLGIDLQLVASEFLVATPQVLLVPVVQAFLGAVWILLWFFFACFLVSQVSVDAVPLDFIGTYREAIGTFERPGKCVESWPTGGAWKDRICEPGDTASGYLGNRCWRCFPPRYALDGRLFYAIFFFLWVNAINIASGELVIAGAVGIWFFSKQKGFGGASSRIGPSVRNLFRFHLGSVAFGAFIIAVVQFVRAIVLFAQKKAEASGNKVGELLAKCVGCCLICVEKFVAHMNKNAYIHVGLIGSHFVTSAKRASNLLSANVVRFAVVEAISEMVTMVGTVFILCFTVLVGYLVLQGLHPEVPPIVPLIAYACVGWVVGKLFMNVLDLAVDTCLMCFLICEAGGYGDDVVPRKLRDDMLHTMERRRMVDSSSEQQQQQTLASAKE